MLSSDTNAKGLNALRRSPAVSNINRFLAHPAYILIVCFLALVGNLFALELAVYTLFVALCVYVFVLGEDLRPIMPLVILCYILPSVDNNPGLSAQSIFSLEQGGKYLLTLAAILVVALILGLLTNKSWGGKAFFTKKRSLLGGFFLLTLTYLLSGVGSQDYGTLMGKNLLFGFTQAMAVCLPYLLFSGGVNWQKIRKDYFAWIGFGVGCVLLGHLLHISPVLLWHGACAAPTSVTTVVTEERRPGIAHFRMSAYGDTSHLYIAGQEPAFSARFCETYANFNPNRD